MSVELVTRSRDWSELLPGDLLFFGRKRENAPDRVTHVAIHLGAGKMIHAAGQVKIESLNPNDSDYSQYRYDQFLQARRMISGEGPLPGVEAVFN